MMAQKGGTEYMSSAAKCDLGSINVTNKKPRTNARDGGNLFGRKLHDRYFIIQLCKRQLLDYDWFPPVDSVVT